MRSDECDFKCRASHPRTAFCHQVQREAECRYTCYSDNVEQQAAEVEETAEGWIQATEPVKSIGGDGKHQGDMGIHMELRAGVRKVVVSPQTTAG